MIDVDEESLKREGRWPWSRKKLAELINKLYDNNVSVITMDVVQSEAETNPAKLVKDALSKLKKPIPNWFSEIENLLDADDIFTKAIKDKELVLGYPFHNKLLTQTGKLPPTSITSKFNDTESLTAIHMLGYTANLNDFTNNATGSGFFSVAPDRDGTLRRAPVIAIYNDQVYPSLALEAARVYLLEDEIKLHTEKVGTAKTVTHLTMGKSIIRTDAQGQILIPYLGKQRHFPYISASQVLHNDKIFPELEGAIVLIGTSAIGLADLRPTPVEASFPGVEIQASILHGILHPESIVYVPDWTEGATIVWLVTLGIFMTLLYPLLQPVSLVIAGISLLVITFYFNLWLWVSQHINLPVIMSLLLIMAISSIYVIYGLLRENKDRKRIHNMFGRYVPVDHINKLIDSSEQLSTDGEKREMTVLFSDLRNFTSLCEPLSTRELKSFLNQYLTPITKIIFDNQGTIDKYVGDMVMAFWGAPLHHPQHANQSVTAALEMQQKITEMQTEFSLIGIDNVAAGIGIHTGEMNVGDMGSDYRRAYTVLGDAVNLGSRLESLTKYYDVKILVSEDTKDQCPEIAFRYVDYVRVKGKQDAIKIYEPVAKKVDLSLAQNEQLRNHQDTFDLYLAGDWKTAEKYFEKAYKETDESIYHLYLKRIKSKIRKAPKNWDGIFTHTEK